MDKYIKLSGTTTVRVCQNNHTVRVCQNKVNRWTKSQIVWLHRIWLLLINPCENYCLIPIDLTSERVSKV